MKPRGGGGPRPGGPCPPQGVFRLFHRTISVTIASMSVLAINAQAGLGFASAAPNGGSRSLQQRYGHVEALSGGFAELSPTCAMSGV